MLRFINRLAELAAENVSVEVEEEEGVGATVLLGSVLIEELEDELDCCDTLTGEWTAVITEYCLDSFNKSWPWFFTLVLGPFVLGFRIKLSLMATKKSPFKFISNPHGFIFNPGRSESLIKC